MVTTKKAKSYKRLQKTGGFYRKRAVFAKDYSLVTFTDFTFIFRSYKKLKELHF